MKQLPQEENKSIWSQELRVDKSVHEQISKDIWKTLTGKELEDVKVGLEMTKGVLDFEDWLHLRDKLYLSLEDPKWVKEVRYHDQ